MSKSLHIVEGIECINQEGKPDTFISEPYVSGIWIFTRYRCICGRKFKTLEQYHTHYRLENESEWFMED